MKIFIFITVCALTLMIVGASLAQNLYQITDDSWPDLMSDMATLWSPFLFAFVIVGFGIWAVRRVSR